ncbi:unnamed protein product [Caenorhabditis sp. 36 PRJEB53466]|nr:unnamed protein product [Caenorhabditis sp. 36 PRJEB53466]
MDRFSSSVSKPSHNWATFGEEWIAPVQVSKSSAPARPPPPKQFSAQSTDNISSVFGIQSTVQPSQAVTTILTSVSDFEIGALSDGVASDEDKRARIIEELISSELQFISDINAYTEAVESSPLLNQKQKVILRNGCAQIVQLSSTLVQLLTSEQIKPMEAQQIGTCFLQLRKPFAQTYGFYFRNIEHINTLLTSAKHEKTMDSVLQDIVKRMRESGAVVIDGPTSVSRPVQRCLKYPLFLNEIVKLTQLNHTDHPKLMEAIKQMSNLGQKMNESKRRKELTQKYMSDDKQTIGEILSKMTFHSLKKKSNRFTYRMGSSLGVVKLLRDSDFDKLVCELDSAERRLVRFNYMLVIYRKKMFHETRVLMHKKLIEPKKKHLSNSEIDLQLQPFNHAIKLWANDVNLKIRDEIVKALRNIPKRLITKRNDKLMDYEAGKTREKGSRKRDFAEIQKDYEALNTQVKQQLPKITEHLTTVLACSMRMVFEQDKRLMETLRKIFNEAKSRSADDQNKLSRSLITSTSACFVDHYDQDRMKPLQKIANKAVQKMPLYENPETEKVSSPPVSGFRGVDYATGLFNPNSLPDEAPPPLPVFMKDTFEFASFPPQSNCDQNSAPIQFPVSFADSPTKLPAPPTTQKRSASAAAQPTNVWSSSVLTRSDSPQPLIPSRPEPKVKNDIYPVLPRQTQPTESLPNESSNQQLPFYSSVPGDTFAISPMYDATPQLSQPRQNSVYDSPPAMSSIYDQAPTGPMSSMRPVLCKVKVDYDFLPQGSNQVAVNEGELIGVLQRTDDDGNPEWLLIKRASGQVGYVPAAYCRPT